MQRKVLVIFAVVALALVMWAGSAVAAADKPNILVIWGDDIGRSDISTYTHGLMGFETPNIDRVANEGTQVLSPKQCHYVDQNNKQGRRFGSPKFVKLLNVIGTKSFIEQKKLINSTLDNWQGNETQRDDITLIGFRIK